MPPVDPSSIPVPSPADEAWALLANPLLLAFGALFMAWAAGRIVADQVRRMGLEERREEGTPGFSWSSFFAALAFWGVLVLGLLGIAARLELTVVARFLEAGFALVLRALMAGAILAGAGVFARRLTEEASWGRADAEAPLRARRERHTVLLVGAILAVAAVTGLSLGSWLLLALLTGPVVLVWRNAQHRARAAELLADLAAGLRLRDQVRADTRVGEGDDALRVTGKLGILRTWVEGTQGRKRLVRNEELLARFTGEHPKGPTPDPAQTGSV